MVWAQGDPSLLKDSAFSCRYLIDYSNSRFKIKAYFKNVFLKKYSKMDACNPFYAVGFLWTSEDAEAHISCSSSQGAVGVS